MCQAGGTDKRFATLACLSELKRRKKRRRLFGGLQITKVSSFPELGSAAACSSVSSGLRDVGETAFRIAIGCGCGSPPTPKCSEPDTDMIPEGPVKKSLGHGFSVLYYKKVRLKPFDNIARSLDNNNKVNVMCYALTA